MQGQSKLISTSACVTAANTPLPKARHTAKPRRKGPGYTLPLPRGPAKLWVYNITTGGSRIGSDNSVFHSSPGREHIWTSGRTVTRHRQGTRNPGSCPSPAFAPRYTSAAVLPPFSVAPSFATSMCQDFLRPLYPGACTSLSLAYLRSRQ